MGVPNYGTISHSWLGWLDVGTSILGNASFNGGILTSSYATSIDAPRVPQTGPGAVWIWLSQPHQEILSKQGCEGNIMKYSREGYRTKKRSNLRWQSDDNLGPEWTWGWKNRKRECFFGGVPIKSGQKNIRAKVGGIIPKGPNISGAFLRRGLAKEKISGWKFQVSEILWNINPDTLW